MVRNGEVGDAIRHHAPAEFSFNDLLGEQRPAREVHGRQEPSVRHLLQALSGTAHADEDFNLVVVRFQILVPEGPVLLVPIATGRFEFVITVAVALSRPAERFATDLAAANPHERLVQWKRVGVLVIVDEELMTVFVAGVAKSLDGLPFEQRSLVHEAAEFELIRPDMLGEVSRGNARGTCLEHQDVHTLFRELLGHPSSAGPGANHKGIIDPGPVREHHRAARNPHLRRSPKVPFLQPLMMRANTQRKIATLDRAGDVGKTWTRQV